MDPQMISEKCMSSMLDSSKKMSEAMNILIRKLDESRDSMKDGYCTAEDFRKRYGIERILE